MRAITAYRKGLHTMEEVEEIKVRKHETRTRGGSVRFPH